MKTILIFVTSLDGKVTKWGDPHVKVWSSHQDQDYYKKIWNDSKLIVMGSNTFNAEPVTPSPNHLLIVMTTHPETYKNLESPGQIEFTNETPGALSESFKKQGREQMLVVGGPHVATSFLEERLVDELWLTIEPRIFGTGGNFATSVQLDIALRLIDSRVVNEEGTLINRYAVIKG